MTILFINKIRDFLKYSRLETVLVYQKFNLITLEYYNHLQE